MIPSEIVDLSLTPSAIALSMNTVGRTLWGVWVGDATQGRWAESNGAPWFTEDKRVAFATCVNLVDGIVVRELGDDGGPVME